MFGAAALAAGFGTADARAQQADAASRARPAAGDLLVLVGSEEERKPVLASDLQVGGQPLLAWAMQPDSQTIRSASRLNQVLLIRLDPAELDEVTRQRSADGILAYSAICTHEQCPVTVFMRDKNVLHCACHGSEFDPRAAARVVGGPAPRPLAALPVRVEDSLVIVGGPFVGRVGNRPTG